MNEIVNCTYCGASQTVEKTSIVSKCNYCRKDYVTEDGRFFRAKTNGNFRGSLENIRNNLKNAIEISDVQEIIRISSIILDNIPNDFTSNYYISYAKALLGNIAYYEKFASADLSHTPDELNIVLQHIVDNPYSRIKDFSTVIINKINPELLESYSENYQLYLKNSYQFIEKESDIFLFYSNKDQESGLIIKEKLEKFGFVVSIKNNAISRNINGISILNKIIKRSKISMILTSENLYEDYEDVNFVVDYRSRFNKQVIEILINKSVSSIFEDTRKIDYNYFFESKEIIIKTINELILLGKNSRDNIEKIDSMLSQDVSPHETILKYKFLADNDNDNAQYILGKMIIDAEVNSLSDLTGIEYLKNASVNKNKMANLLLGRLHEDGLYKNISYTNCKKCNEGKMIKQENNLYNCNNCHIAERSEEIIKINYSIAIGYYELAGVDSDISIIKKIYKYYLEDEYRQPDYLKAIYWLVLAEKRGDYEAINLLGELYLNGFGVNQDYLKAFNHFNKISSVYPDSEINLAKCYYYGLGCSIDLKKANEILIKYTAKNNIKAKHLLASINLDRNLNVDESLDYLKQNSDYGFYESKLKLVEEVVNRLKVNYYQQIQPYLSDLRNDSKSLYLLYLVYKNGLGVSADNNKAGDYLEQAGTSGSLEANLKLSLCYKNGDIFGTIDLEKSNSILLKLVEINYIDSFKELARRVLKEKMIIYDPEKVVLLLQRINSQDDGEIFYLLGLSLSEGYGSIKNLNEAEAMFIKSAGMGFKEAFKELGNLYFNQTSKDNSNFDKALAFYLKSEKSSERDFKIGYCYLRSSRIDENNAERFLRSSARNDHLESIEMLAEYYTKIKQIPNPKEGFKWYLKACELGSKFGCINLGLIYFHGINSEFIDYQKSFELFSSEELKNDKIALFYLGLLHENLLFADADKNKALTYFEESASLGLEQAIKKVKTFKWKALSWFYRINNIFYKFV